VVLVVDPDPQFLAVARDFLETETGFRVEVAQDGFTGGMLVGLLCPDVLVVSEDHPDFDLTKIVAAVETIRHRKPMKLVACTALQDEFRDQTLLGVGFDAVVQKTMGWTKMAALFRTLA
jgi:DNA-binding response OmpR family regulator